MDEKESVDHFAAELQGATPKETLIWALKRYSPRLVVVSNYGPSTLVVIHHLADIHPATPIFHLNTGFEFEETARLGTQLEERYGIRITEIRPKLTVEEQAQVHGAELFRTNPDLCCYMRKVAPLADALVGYDAWVTGIRKSQADTRKQAKVVEWDEQHTMVKVNPLAEWTSKQVWEFVRSHDIPYNPLHDQGYPSIGCVPCTRPVKDGEDERAGRWSGLGKTECGIHLNHFARAE